MTYLEIRNVRKDYGSVAAIQQLSLRIAEGEFVSLLGPSGCGKTTTLQIIAGFVAPTVGSIIVDGRDITQTPVKDRGIGLVFQSYALFPHMSVAENVAFGLQMRKIPKPEQFDRVKRSLDLTGLSHLHSRYPRQLSGGQQQRVALARATVIEPKLLLLDEPMSNLDASLKESLQDEIKKLQQQLGITTILVTHDQNEALALSNRIAVMDQGKLIQFDRPENIYSFPSDRFVSNFVGRSNLFLADIYSRSNDRCIIKIGQIDLNMDSSYVPNSAAGDQIYISIRPESIALGNENGSRISASVSRISFHGNYWLIWVESNIGQILVFKQNELHSAPFNVGDRVGVNWDDINVRVVSS
jgi:putative spermidine/putrescine transport system ATP-binding protein